MASYRALATHSIAIKVLWVGVGDMGLQKDYSRLVGKRSRTSLLQLDEKPAPLAIAPKTCCRLAIPVSEW